MSNIFTILLITKCAFYSCSKPNIRMCMSIMMFMRIWDSMGAPFNIITWDPSIPLTRYYAKIVEQVKAVHVMCISDVHVIQVIYS